MQELLDRSDIETSFLLCPSQTERAQSRGALPLSWGKDPSFNLYPETASFYCFGCGKGRSVVITFIKKSKISTYLDAVKFLADRAGMAMPENKMNDAASRMRLRVLRPIGRPPGSITRCSTRRRGQAGLDYYHSRGYPTPPSVISGWDLPRQLGRLCGPCEKGGFHDELDLLDAGLAVNNQTISMTGSGTGSCSLSSTSGARSSASAAG